VNRLVIVAGLTMATTMLAQNPPAKSPPKLSVSKGSVTRGKDLFAQKCALCHNADSDVKKIGPGLKGIFKRGSFSVNGNKITDQSLKSWIENGDTMMPPFKGVLGANQIKDVIAYVKTL
jgi:cytochrome c2